MAAGAAARARQLTAKEGSASQDIESRSGKQAPNRLLAPTKASMAKAKGNPTTKPEARRKLAKAGQSVSAPAGNATMELTRPSKIDPSSLGAITVAPASPRTRVRMDFVGSERGAAPRKMWGVVERRNKEEASSAAAQGPALGCVEKEELPSRKPEPLVLGRPSWQSPQVQPARRPPLAEVKLKAEEKRPKSKAGKDAASGIWFDRVSSSSLGSAIQKGGGLPVPVMEDESLQASDRDVGSSLVLVKGKREPSSIKERGCSLPALRSTEESGSGEGQGCHHTLPGMEPSGGVGPSSSSDFGASSAPSTVAEDSVGAVATCEAGRTVSSIEVLSAWPPPGTTTLCPFWPTNAPSQLYPAIQGFEAGVTTPGSTSHGGKRWQKNIQVDSVTAPWSAAHIGETSPVSVLDLMDESPSPPFANQTLSEVENATELQGSLLAALEELPENSSARSEDQDFTSTADSEADASDVGHDQDKYLLLSPSISSGSSAARVGAKDGLLSLLQPFTAQDLKQLGEFEGMEQDLEYVRRILVASSFGGHYSPPWHSESLPLNPALFEELELTRADPASAAKALKHEEGRCQRRLLFDAVNEALGRRLAPFRERPPWVKTRKVLRPRPKGKDLLREVWAEIHEWPVPTSEDVYDVLDDAARRDMTRGVDKWCDVGEDEAALAFELEAHLFEGLLEEVIDGFIAVEKKRAQLLQMGPDSSSCRKAEPSARGQAPQLSLLRRTRV